MIYTLTLNPAVDVELRVDSYQFEHVSRAISSQTDCGGKGFNVSRMLKNLGTSSVAMGFLGGKTGERLESLLRIAGVKTDVVWIEGETRTNFSIVSETDSRQLKINEAGPTITELELAELFSSVRRNIRAGDWWVLGGSLPPGVPDNVYAQLVTLIEGSGAHVILDSSGEAMRLGCLAQPSIIKPNEAEGRDLVNISDIDNPDDHRWISQVLALGPKSIVMSMGKKGALLVTHQGITQLKSPVIEENNASGAGDALVGGLVWGLDQRKDMLESSRYGMACGAATASQPGTRLGDLSTVMSLYEQINVERVSL